MINSRGRPSGPGVFLAQSWFNAVLISVNVNKPLQVKESSGDNFVLVFGRRSWTFESVGSYLYNLAQKVTWAAATSFWDVTSWLFGSKIQLTEFHFACIDSSVRKTLYVFRLLWTTVPNYKLLPSPDAFYAVFVTLFPISRFDFRNFGHPQSKCVSREWGD